MDETSGSRVVTAEYDDHDDGHWVITIVNLDHFVLRRANDDVFNTFSMICSGQMCYSKCTQKSHMYSASLYLQNRVKMEKSTKSYQSEKINKNCINDKNTINFDRKKLT